MFIDRVAVRVEAGTGGSGCLSFRREFRVPMGGPDGGDGGRGGDVFVRADSNLATLLDYTYRDAWEAERGEHGMGNNKTGRSGADLVLPVPAGTVVIDADSGAHVGEVLEDGDTLLVARGGRGGKGNAFFATSTHQSPREWQPGEEGESRRLTLELKLIADVGLVGPPNAGKSTLLSVISAAHPKIAEYPFTTLSPNLGVVSLSDHRTFVVADVPGIIRRRTRRPRTRLAISPAHRADSPAGLARFPSTRSTGRTSTTSCARRSGRTRVSCSPSRIASCSRRWTSSARTSRRRSMRRMRSPCGPSVPQRGRDWITCSQPGGPSFSICAARPVIGVSTLPSHCPSPAARVEVWERGTPPYPHALESLDEPPQRLYAIGNRGVLDRQAIAVVGARCATDFSLSFTRRLCRTLAQHGGCVVSGLAIGVDAAAHEGALEADGGRTCAVLGGGLDIGAPETNRALRNTIAERGLLLSEWAPGVEPEPWMFPHSEPHYCSAGAGNRARAGQLTRWCTAYHARC